MQTPHDRFFRRVFSDPENAAGELKSVLPAEVVRAVDWSTLSAVPGTFVDARLAERRTDVLFSVTLGGGQPALIYVLAEHQSTLDAFMPLRLLGYMVRVWEAWLEENPRARRLPAIVSLVVQHDESGWRAPVTMAELFDLDPDQLALFGRYLPSFEFLLDDLSCERDAALRARAATALARLALLCLKHARTSTDMTRQLAEWLELVADVVSAPNGVAALATVMGYILEVSQTSPERLRDFARQLGPRAEEAYMTGGQILIEQGRAEGEAKGRAEGEAKGRADVLLKLLAVKFGTLSDETTKRVRSASLEQLDRYAERVLTAKTLGEVLS